MKQPTTYNFSFSFDSITLYGTIFGIVLGAAFAISTSSLLAWNAPSATPPNGNVSGSPITTGAAQTKAGSLTLGTGASMTAPRYCIGSSCITAWPAGGAGEEADTLATVAARGNRTTGFIQADEMRACGGGSCSYLRNAGNNYLRGNTFFNGVLYDENNTDYYLDPSHWSRVNRLHVPGDTAISWPNDNDDAATVEWVNWRIGQEETGASAETDTLATVAARGNRTTGFIQADEMRACGGGSCSYLRNAGNNYLRGNTYFDGVLYDEDNTDYYLDPSRWSRVDRLRVSGDSVFGWPNDDDDAATVAWVNARVGVSVVAGCGSDTYYNCAGCWGGATCGSWGSAMRCPAGSWRIPIQYNGLCVR